jgi:hypothetical protein
MLKYSKITVWNTYRRVNSLSKRKSHTYFGILVAMCRAAGMSEMLVGDKLMSTLAMCRATGITKNLEGTS